MSAKNEPKYKMLKNYSISFFKYRLFRIVALKDFETHDGRKVKRGDLGGFIETEDNLSQEGTCWIFKNAKVFAGGKVRDDAIICGYALVYDYAEVMGRSIVHNSATVYKHAKLIDGEVKAGDVHTGPGAKN
ncbi:hypothetical protein IIY24_00365 [Candidatus Saccharibacteria bacterium]|nr:hypothetical protein [Candidatus Saccharibacteria bacterium]